MIIFTICRIPDSIGKDIEKACQGIYPLHDVYIRKVKVLKKPKFDGKMLSITFVWKTSIVNKMLYKYRKCCPLLIYDGVMDTVCHVTKRL